MTKTHISIKALLLATIISMPVMAKPTLVTPSDSVAVTDKSAILSGLNDATKEMDESIRRLLKKFKEEDYQTVSRELPRLQLANDNVKRLIESLNMPAAMAEAMEHNKDVSELIVRLLKKLKEEDYQAISRELPRLQLANNNVKESVKSIRLAAPVTPATPGTLSEDAARLLPLMTRMVATLNHLKFLHLLKPDFLKAISEEMKLDMEKLGTGPTNQRLKRQLGAAISHLEMSLSEVNGTKAPSLKI